MAHCRQSRTAPTDPPPSLDAIGAFGVKRAVEGRISLGEKTLNYPQREGVVRAEHSPLTAVCGTSQDDLACAAVAVAALGSTPPADVADVLAAWSGESPEVLDAALDLAKSASDQLLGLPPLPNASLERAIVILSAACRRVRV